MSMNFRAHRLDHKILNQFGRVQEADEQPPAPRPSYFDIAIDGLANGLDMASKVIAFGLLHGETGEPEAQAEPELAPAPRAPAMRPSFRRRPAFAPAP